MNQSKKYIFKIVVVGDGGIGKSTMIQRLITGKYIEARAKGRATSEIRKLLELGAKKARILKKGEEQTKINQFQV